MAKTKYKTGDIFHHITNRDIKFIVISITSQNRVFGRTITRYGIMEGIFDDFEIVKEENN